MIQWKNRNYNKIRLQEWLQKLQTSDESNSLAPGPLLQPYFANFPWNTPSIPAPNWLRLAKKSLAAGHISNFQTAPRTCIHNLNSPSGRVFSRHAALNFLEINLIIPAKICLACRKNPSAIRRFRL